MKWKEEFRSKELKVNFKKTEVIMSGLRGEILKSKINPCAKGGYRVMANSVLCAEWDKLVNNRCAKLKRVTPTMAKGFAEGCAEAI